nr:hypothetical protein Iba_chr01cCG5290 [Ipomoea batatas]
MVEIFSGDGNSGGGSRGSDFDWRLLAMVELRWWLLRVTGSTGSSERSLAIAISPLFPLLSRMFSSGGDRSGGRWIGNDEILGADGDDSLMQYLLRQVVVAAVRGRLGAGSGDGGAAAWGSSAVVVATTPPGREKEAKLRIELSHGSCYHCHFHLASPSSLNLLAAAASNQASSESVHVATAVGLEDQARRYVARRRPPQPSNWVLLSSVNDVEETSDEQNSINEEIFPVKLRHLSILSRLANYLDHSRDQRSCTKAIAN